MLNKDENNNWNFVKSIINLRDEDIYLLNQAIAHKFDKNALAVLRDESV